MDSTECVSERMGRIFPDTGVQADIWEYRSVDTKQAAVDAGRTREYAGINRECGYQNVPLITEHFYAYPNPLLDLVYVIFNSG